MLSAFDVAEYILKKKGAMTAMKLQKLVYYSQAWAAVWDEEPLFDEKIEAWANGPVIRDLFEKHKGEYKVGTVGGDSARLNDVNRETVDAVLDHYGDKSAQWLIELTHLEDPWIQAREGLEPFEQSNREITLGSMADYYSSLL